MFDSTTLMYSAAISHYEAQRDESLAVLQLYLENSAAVADHSNILEEIKKWSVKLAEAEECLEVLEKYSEKC